LHRDRESQARAKSVRCRQNETKFNKETDMKLKVLSLIALLAGAASGAQAEGQLKIGTEGAYPPWSMADANGAVTGFDADVGNLLCTKLAMECVFVVQAFDGLIPALQAKQFDIIISGMSITADRKKEINFSIGYAELANKVVVAKGSDLAGITEIPALLPLWMAIRSVFRPEPPMPISWKSWPRPRR